MPLDFGQATWRGVTLISHTEPLHKNLDALPFVAWLVGCGLILSPVSAAASISCYRRVSYFMYYSSTVLRILWMDWSTGCLVQCSNAVVFACCQRGVRGRPRGGGPQHDYVTPAQRPAGLLQGCAGPTRLNTPLAQP